MSKEDELRIVHNFIREMTKAYRKRTQNCVVVRDILMAGTTHAGMTSCVIKCRELGIDPYGYNLVIWEVSE